MPLKLVASGNERALTIRDHLLPSIRERGSLQVQRDVVRLIALELGPWLFNHWTPFHDLAPEEAASPGYRRALEHQRNRTELPYGLDVWHDGEKVLSVLWASHGAFAIPHFERGAWEDEALAL